MTVLPLVTKQLAMFKPLRPLKYLPWGTLLQVAGLATLATGLIELLVIAAIDQVNLGSLLASLFLLVEILKVGFGFGAGVLAVFVLQRWFSRLYINASVLWALVGCLVLTLWIKTLLPLAWLVGLDQSSVVGALLGVFWYGRHHWRR